MWQKEPFKIEVKADESKAYCNCGKSKNGPFCDGSHAGSGKKPSIITYDKDETKTVCGCLTSGALPYCDGSHLNLK
jgi:CDGSH-type Zn-finger protein